MLIYNTKSAAKEEFITQTQNAVKAYVCGPTVYDYSHIGHARTYVNFDVLRRYLEATGYDVAHVQNFTDVEDKITSRAKEMGVEPMQLADRFIEEYFRDMDSLNVKRATVYPRVSQYIPNIIEVTRKLLAKGFAYQAGGAIYFDIGRAGGVGELVKDIEGSLADDIEMTSPNKRGPFDFVLWREAKEGEEGWDSPWGKGRPGWHAECVAMAQANLGEVLDIHWGGKDLIYPHHEAEALIAKALTGKDFVRYWAHNEFVLLKGRKMSKSTGNTVFIRDVLKSWQPEVLRMLLLSKNYRERVEYSVEELKRTQAKYAVIKSASQQARTDWNGRELSSCVMEYSDAFFGALDNDLETGKALAAVEALSGEMTSGRLQKDFGGAARIFDAVEGILGIKL